MILKAIKNNKWLIIILVIGIFLRLYNLDFQSPWLDEIHTLTETNPNTPISELYNVVLVSEQMPPLYFFLMYVTFKVFGYSIFIARLFSAIVGGVSIYSVFLLGKEITNNKLGLIASFLMAINPFHLYYSQEARPYMLLLLFSVLSFYGLVKLLQNQTNRNAILYGLFSGLMIITHFFGLFVVFSQLIIILFYFFMIEKEKRIQFILKMLISGVISTLLLTTAIKAFIKVSQIKDFWISPPTSDAFTSIFKEFFGNSEIVLSLISICVFFYFLKLVKEKNCNLNERKILKNKTIFGFTILIPWITILVLIPLVRSYTAAPMIISRYFIVVLPAIIFLITIGLNQFKNKLFQYTFLALIFVFSITDIVIVKNYYENINKAQFREATTFLIENNSKNDKVVSSLSWYLTFFFKEHDSTNIVNSNLDDYVAQMMKDSTKISSFWYFDGHDRTFTSNSNTLEFIDKNFYIDNNYDGFQAWTKHFELQKNISKTIDFSKFGKIHTINGDSFLFNIEKFEIEGNLINTSGWAFFQNEMALKTKIDIVLLEQNSLKGIKLNINKENRPDVTTYFDQPYNVDNSGFSAKFDFTKLKKGIYNIAIYLHNKNINKEGLIITDKTFEKR